MAPASGLRIGDAEREATAAGLREHYAQGRLDLEEFNQRLNAVFAAKTDADLARITGDLPYVTGHGQLWPAAAAQQSGRQSSRGSWQQYARDQGSSQQGTWQQGCRQPGRSRAQAVLGALTLIVAIALIASLATPFALFGFTASRPLLILLAVFTFGRRILRRVLGGGPVRGRRR